MAFQIWFRVGGEPWVASGPIESRDVAEERLTQLRKNNPDREYEIRQVEPVHKSED